jgi:hypothetical protein
VADVALDLEQFGLLDRHDSGQPRIVVETPHKVSPVNGTSATSSRLASDSRVGWKAVWAAGGGFRNAYRLTADGSLERLTTVDVEDRLMDVVVR